jgi:hypothetical protein
MTEDKIADYLDFIRPETEEDYIKFCHANSTHWYSCLVVISAQRCMEMLSHPKEGAVIVHKHKTVEEAWEETMKEFDGHSGYTAGCTANAVAHFSPRGEEFRVFWNKRCGGTGTEKGTINPAILTIGAKNG